MLRFWRHARDVGCREQNFGYVPFTLGCPRCHALWGAYGVLHTSGCPQRLALLVVLRALHFGVPSLSNIKMGEITRETNMLGYGCWTTF
jgi:hypothetical protein